MLRIREICKEKGIAVVELAKRLNMPRANIYKIERGNPTLMTMQQVAMALGVSVCDLIEDPRSRSSF